jgi:hypothetical protein
VHGLLELLLVEELEDEEDELAAERRHGCGRPFRGRSAEPEGGGPGAFAARAAANPRVSWFVAAPVGTREAERCGRGEGGEEERERKSSLAFLDALQTSRPFLSPHATQH